MIGILAGGDSPEHDVSLLSGKGVFDALQRRGHSARLVEIDTLDDLIAVEQLFSNRLRAWEPQKIEGGQDVTACCSKV